MMISQITPDWTIFLWYPSALLGLSSLSFSSSLFLSGISPFSFTKMANTVSILASLCGFLPIFGSLSLITSITTVSQASCLTGNGNFTGKIRLLMLLDDSCIICGIVSLLLLPAFLSAHVEYFWRFLFSDRVALLICQGGLKFYWLLLDQCLFLMTTQYLQS